MMQEQQIFPTQNHTLALSKDGSYTAYSKEYDEHYHSTQDGALSESLFKHVIPALNIVGNKDELFILDICYGLGFNTLATLYYVTKHYPEKKLYIYSPELDEELVYSLETFSYPQEFQQFRSIIKSLSKDGVYRDETFYIELFLGDAREYVKQFHQHFDIVYQDAFSPSTNPLLWTKEYFYDIAEALRDDGILTTYSTALKTRLALYENGFELYINQGEGYRDATLASKKLLLEYKKVDMEHKIACNPAVKPLSDSELT